MGGRIVGRAVDRGDVCRHGRRSERRRKNPAGAEFKPDQLHDELQLDGGDLRDDMHQPRHGPYRRRDHDQQCHFEYGVSGQLLDGAPAVSDNLRAKLSFAVG